MLDFHNFHSEPSKGKREACCQQESDQGPESRSTESRVEELLPWDLAFRPGGAWQWGQEGNVSPNTRHHHYMGRRRCMPQVAKLSCIVYFVLPWHLFCKLQSFLPCSFQFYEGSSSFWQCQLVGEPGFLCWPRSAILGQTWRDFPPQRLRFQQRRSPATHSAHHPELWRFQNRKPGSQCLPPGRGQPTTLLHCQSQGTQSGEKIPMTIQTKGK